MHAATQTIAGFCAFIAPSLTVQTPPFHAQNNINGINGDPAGDAVLHLQIRQSEPAHQATGKP